MHRYYDQKHAQYGSLRVINEDRVDAHTGFGTHGHREFEIFSYVVSGELEQYVFPFLSVIYLDADSATVATRWATARCSSAETCK